MALADDDDMTVGSGRVTASQASRSRRQSSFSTPQSGDSGMMRTTSLAPSFHLYFQYMSGSGRVVAGVVLGFEDEVE